MGLYGVSFYLIGAVILGSTALAVTRREAVDAIVWLTASFLGTALLFYLLGAPMLAALEVILYAGAIMVLFLFVVMLLGPRDPSRAPSRWKLPTLLGGGIVLAAAFLMVVAAAGGREPLSPATASPAGFAAHLFSRYWLAVEAVSFLIFIALAGALHLGRAGLPVRSREPRRTGDGQGGDR